MTPPYKNTVSSDERVNLRSDFLQTLGLDNHFLLCYDAHELNSVCVASCGVWPGC